MQVYSILALVNNRPAKLIISLPDNLSEITLAQFLAITRLKADESPDYIKNVLRVVTDLPDEVIIGLQVEHLQIMYNSLEWLENIKLNHDGPVPSSFRFNRVRYYLPEHKDIGHNSYAELEDAKIVITKYQDDPFEAIPDLLAIYCRPKFGSWWMPRKLWVRTAYKHSEAKDRAIQFLGLDMQTALSCACFFLARLEFLVSGLEGFTPERSTPKMNYRQGWKSLMRMVRSER